MADKIRVGMIGLGRISTLHLPAYDQSQNQSQNINAELVAICDKNKKRLKEVAQEFNIPESNCYTDYGDLLKQNTVDAVEILVPHHLHAEITIAAAKAGKSISLQKVPAMTLSEMDRMIKAAQENSVHFRVFENFRFHEPYMKAMAMIETGLIGKTERIDYRMYGGFQALSGWKVPLKSSAWRLTEKDNYKSPTIFDDGYHKHSVISWMLQESIDSVITWQGKYNIKVAGIPTPIRLDTPFNIIYTCKNKAHYATLSSSTHDFFPMHSDYYSCDEYMDVIGEKGAIFIPGCTGSWFKNCEAGPGKEGVHWCTADGKWHSDTSMNSDWAQSFINCSKDFIEGIRTGKQAQLSPEDARYILQIGLDAVKSTRENFREVKLKEITDGI
ncbi:MAG: Gfo/Idh/MocA family oxidoreductase [Promethearchaeota archaeon]|nr:MAG: Gfo/Idh/MocA family oxidoreductase [Candidatus Lokiarchaeota archaeon]